MACAHRLCDLIGGECSLAVMRSRGCRPMQFATTAPPGLVDEVRGLLAELSGEAARRLAQLVRREALEQRNLVAQLRDDDPELADRVAALVNPRGARSLVS